jgi:hypothetical protein
MGMVLGSRGEPLAAIAAFHHGQAIHWLTGLPAIETRLNSDYSPSQMLALENLALVFNFFELHLSCWSNAAQGRRAIWPQLPLRGSLV